jgi:hypothetical protein
MTTAQVESRLTALEQEVARLKSQIAETPSRRNNWVEAIAGTFSNDPIFDEAMRLGRKWRVAQRPQSVRGGSSRSSSAVRGAKR